MSTQPSADTVARRKDLAGGSDCRVLLRGEKKTMSSHFRKPLTSVAQSSMRTQQTLNPIQAYMLRLVLFGAGRTVVHRGRVCEIWGVHTHIRLLHPLFPPDNTRTFWVPRLAADRKRFRAERDKRKLTSGNKNMYGQPPCWFGDQRPREAETVIPTSIFPTASELKHLVGIGYPKSAAFAALTTAHNPWMHLFDRWKNRSGAKSPSGAKHPEHPYIYFSPNRRTKTGGGFLLDAVWQAIAAMRASHNMRLAVFEVLYYRRSARRVAMGRKVNARALIKAASRVRCSLRTPEATEAAA